jgi:hypothetical protein
MISRGQFLGNTFAAMIGWLSIDNWYGKLIPINGDRHDSSSTWLSLLRSKVFRLYSLDPQHPSGPKDTFLVKIDVD